MKKKKKKGMPSPKEMMELAELCAQAQLLSDGKVSPETGAMYLKYWRMYWEEAGVDPDLFAPEKCREAMGH